EAHDGPSDQPEVALHGSSHCVEVPSSCVVLPNAVAIAVRMPYGVLERTPHVRHGIRGMNLSGLRRVGSYRWGDVEAACIGSIACRMHAIVRGSERRVAASTGAIDRTEGAAAFLRGCRRAA